jgi:hypothetical protein
MAIFGGFKRTLRKSEAAALIELILEHLQKAGRTSLKPNVTANKLVTVFLEDTPRISQRSSLPHKVPLAAMALAHSFLEKKYDRNSSAIFQICLSLLLADYEATRDSHRLTPEEYTFIAASGHALEATINDFIDFE